MPQGVKIKVLDTGDFSYSVDNPSGIFPHSVLTEGEYSILWFPLWHRIKDLLDARGDGDDFFLFLLGFRSATVMNILFGLKSNLLKCV